MTDFQQAFPFLETDINQTISTRFEHVAARYSGHPAVVSNGRVMEYGQLDRLANRIAHALIHHDGTGHAVVATLLGHDELQIGALLGSLKAGKAFVSLNGHSPESLLRSILDDSGASILLTDYEHEAQAGQLVESPVRRVNLSQWVKRSSDSPINLSTDPAAMAYLSYTSGSSGEPKGVIKIHRAMMEITHVATLDYGFTPNDRISLLVSMSFAASRFGFLGSLLNGATLCLYDLGKQGVERLAGWVEDSGVTILHVLPSTLRTMLERLPAGRKFQQVRFVVVGGEPLKRHDLELYQQHFPEESRLVNTYAASEAGVITRLTLDHRSDFDELIIPLGYPVKGIQVSLLDQEMYEDYEPGTGEIIVTGNTVAPGYWSSDDKSAIHFSQASEPSMGRVFRTHDLGRIDDDGCLRMLGRIDEQIKIHGVRTQPEAIEAALERHPGVRQAAVVTQEGEDEEPELVGFFEASEQRSPSVTELRIWLLETLPTAMIPAYFIELNQLPRTQNGKVDLQRLQRQAGNHIVRGRTSSLPFDSVETTLIRIWENTLRITPIGVDDDYFEMGGDSLLAISLFQRIERTLGIRLPLSSLFYAPTIRTQAERIREGKTDEPLPALVAIQPQGEKPPFFCVSPLVVDVLAYRDLALRLGLDIPFYALYAHGQRRNSSLRTVQDQARLYLDEIRKLQPEGPYFIGGYSNGGKLAFEMANQLRDQGQDVERLILLETYGPKYFDNRTVSSRRLLRRLQAIRRIQRGIQNFPPWLKMHLETLASLDWTGRWRYLRLKTTKRRQHFQNNIRRFTRQVAKRNNPERALYRTPTSRAVYAYQPRPFHGNITIVRAEKQLLGVRPDPYLGWGDLVSGNVELIEVPGYHDSILFGPRVATLAEHLRNSLDPSSKKTDNLSKIPD
jgi:amino acid adenylation domain-containing protein